MGLLGVPTYWGIAMWTPKRDRNFDRLPFGFWAKLLKEHRSDICSVGRRFHYGHSLGHSGCIDSP